MKKHPWRIYFQSDKSDGIKMIIINAKTKNEAIKKFDERFPTYTIMIVDP